MRHPIRFERLLQKLPPKQRRLDLDNSDLWAQLPVADRQACRAALASLLARLAVSMSCHDQYPREENDEHER